MMTTKHQGLYGLVAALCLLVSACGFQLRGNVDIPDSLKKVYLSQKERSATVVILKRLMESNGIDLVASPELAPYQLNILSEQHQRRSVSLSSSAKTEEYELRSSLRFSIVNKEGVELLEPTEVFTERVYRFDENNVSAKDAEEALIRKEMNNNLAQQVLRRYLGLANAQSQ